MIIIIIILNTPEINLKPGRTNSTTKERGSTSKKLGSVDTWFGREMDQGCGKMKEPWSWRKTRKRGAHRGMHHQNHWLGKWEQLIFKSSNQGCLKTAVLKFGMLGCDRALRELPTPGERQANNQGGDSMEIVI